MAEKELILKCRGISKDFGITRALKEVDFDVARGEIRGLIGENGSGKSTLTAIMAGMHQATAGTMTLNGREWKPQSILEAQENKIGIIVQEAGTIDMITVAENMFLGKESMFKKAGFINRSEMIRQAQQALEDIGAGYIDAAAMTYTLNMQDRKLVEIAKAMKFDPDIFIVDETTTALSQTGRDILYKLIRELAAKNKAVLLISHDLAEVMEYCDTLSVLKDGTLVRNLDRSEYSEDLIRSLMIGREMEGNYYRNDKDGYDDAIMLKLDHVTTLDGLTDFSLELHSGEILGVGGLSQCGMHELGRAVAGLATVCTGKILMGGNEIKDPVDAFKNGIGYTSKDRDHESLALSASIYDNIASTGYDANKGFGPFMSVKKERAYVDAQIESLSIKCQGPKQAVKALSGGNKQKVVFGKWMARNANLLVLDCPTRGVDIGVKAEMYKLITAMKKDGRAILLISEELPELLGMSDRLIIMKDNVISAEFEDIRNNPVDEADVIQYII